MTLQLDFTGAGAAETDADVGGLKVFVVDAVGRAAAGAVGRAAAGVLGTTTAGVLGTTTAGRLGAAMGALGSAGTPGAGAGAGAPTELTGGGPTIG